jgi:hypothetical protein
MGTNQQGGRDHSVLTIRRSQARRSEGLDAEIQVGLPAVILFM